MSYRVKPTHPILAKVDGVWVQAKWKIASGPQTKSPDGKSHKANAHITLPDGKVVRVPYGDVRFLPNGMDEQAHFLLKDLNAAEQNNANLLDLGGKFRDLDNRRLLFGDKLLYDTLPEHVKQYPTTPEECVEAPALHSVADTADDDEVVWENELRDAYVMVDTATGNVFTYRVALAQGIKTLADLDLLMQLNGWQLAQDAVQPPITGESLVDAVDSLASTFRNWDGKDSGIPKTAADAKEGDLIWYMIDGERHYSLIGEVLGNGIGLDRLTFLPNTDFGTKWGFVAPNLPKAPRESEIRTFVPPSRIRVLDDLYMDQETYDKRVARIEETAAKAAEASVQPLIKVYTIADGSGNEIATYIPESDQFIILGSHDPSDPMASQVAAEEFDRNFGNEVRGRIRLIGDGEMQRVSLAFTRKTAADAQVGDMVWIEVNNERRFGTTNMIWVSNGLYGNKGEELINVVGLLGTIGHAPMSDFGINWGFANPYKPAGDEIAAEQPDDASKENNEPEEAVKTNTEMLALVWDAEIMGDERMDYRVWGRQHVSGDRWYVIQTRNDSIQLAAGTTSILKVTHPMPMEVFKWGVNSFHNWGAYLEDMNNRSGKGSVIHGTVPDGIKCLLPDLDDTRGWLDYLQVACARNGCKGMEREWLYEVQRSFVSIRQWAIDYNVRFLAVERCFYSADLHTAGQIDFVVEMDRPVVAGNRIRPPKPDKEEIVRILAIADLKTGSESGTHTAQLAIYRRLLLDGFPRIKEIIRERYPAQLMGEGNYYNIPVYLLLPKPKWRKNPAYSFLDRSLKADEYAQTLMNHHLEIFKASRPQPGGRTRLKGPANFSVNNSNALDYQTMEDIWMKKIQDGDTEPIEDINEEEETE